MQRYNLVTLNSAILNFRIYVKQRFRTGETGGANALERSVTQVFKKTEIKMEISNKIRVFML